MANVPAKAEAEWVEDVTEQLDQIKGKDAQKKRDTIIALVDARLNKRADSTAFRQIGTGHKITYHRSWKHDPTFASVLAEVERLATHWRNQRQARYLAEAADRLAQLAPAAATVLAKAMRSPDLNVALKAAFGVLDRAGLQTAVKQQHEHTGPEGLPVGTLMSLEEWRRYQSDQKKGAEDILDAFDAQTIGETALSA